MIINWKSNQNSIPSNIDSIISTAKVNNCWIYIESKKTFYTPDELVEIWRHVYHAGNKTNNINEFKIVTPMYAIRLATQWVNVANSKLQEIINKANNYDSEFKIKK